MERNLINNQCVVLGNGTSRLQFDLQIIHKLYITYACNRIYVDYIPDHIIAVDWPMIDEVSVNCYNKTNIYTQELPSHMKYVHNYGVKLLPNPRGSSLDSGTWSVLLASEHGYKHIYIVGFDYHQGHYNHVYANKSGYANVDFKQPLTKDFEWQKRLKDIIVRYSDITYTRIVGSNVTLINSFETLKNYNEISIQQFKEKLCLNSTIM